LWEIYQGSVRAPGAPGVKTPNSLNNKSRISAILLELQVPGILLRSWQTPKLRSKKLGKLGFLNGSWNAPARPGECFTGKWQKSAIFILPGVLTVTWEMIILQVEAPELLDFCEDLD
jgi:hypothetical protein